MGLFEAMLRKFGYVKVDPQGLAVDAEGQIVPQHEASGGQSDVHWRAHDGRPLPLAAPVHTPMYVRRSDNPPGLEGDPLSSGELHGTPLDHDHWITHENDDYRVSFRAIAEAGSSPRSASPRRSARRAATSPAEAEAICSRIDEVLDADEQAWEQAIAAAHARHASHAEAARVERTSLESPMARVKEAAPVRALRSDWGSQADRRSGSGREVSNAGGEVSNSGAPFVGSPHYEQPYDEVPVQSYDRHTGDQDILVSSDAPSQTGRYRRKRQQTAPLGSRVSRRQSMPRPAASRPASSARGAIERDAVQTRGEGTKPIWQPQLDQIADQIDKQIDESIAVTNIADTVDTALVDSVNDDITIDEVLTDQLAVDHLAGPALEFARTTKTPIPRQVPQQAPRQPARRARALAAAPGQRRPGSQRPRGDAPRRMITRPQQTVQPPARAKISRPKNPRANMRRRMTTADPRLSEATRPHSVHPADLLRSRPSGSQRARTADNGLPGISAQPKNRFPKGTPPPPMSEAAGQTSQAGEAPSYPPLPPSGMRKYPRSLSQAKRETSSRQNQREALARVIALAKPRTAEAQPSPLPMPMPPGWKKPSVTSS